MTLLLRTRGLSKHFGGVSALENLELDLEEGVITGLLGPNGAGKTTLFNVITGNLKADAGSVELHGKSILGLPSHRIARLGVARSFQDLKLFSHMTVRQNLQAATEGATWLWQPRRTLAAREAAIDRALELTGLAGVATSRPTELAYAERKFLSLARIMATGARIWLLDEPASGLDHASRKRFAGLLRDSIAGGTTICLIEHNVDMITELASRIVFLERGRKIAEGPTEEIVSDPKLIDIYFGTKRK